MGAIIAQKTKNVNTLDLMTVAEMPNWPNLNEIEH